MASRRRIAPPPLSATWRVALLATASLLLVAATCLLCQDDKLKTTIRVWPDKRLNILIDPKSFNQTELQLVESALEQLDRSTCVRVNKLPSNFNPFEAPPERDEEDANNKRRNFVYLFKSQVSGATLSNLGHPSIGLSSLGCIGARQSLVLTELAFRWPELILSYHLMRTLGVERLERPDGQVRRLLNVLPLSQKIASGADSSPSSSAADAYLARGAQLMTFAAAAGSPDGQANQSALIFSDSDLNAIKQLYSCSDFLGKLSPAKLSGNIAQQSYAPSLPESRPAPKASDLPDADAADGELNKAAKQIADSLAEPQQCKPLEACPLQLGATGAGEPREHADDTFSMRPMILKLDEFHAQDPHLRQANQMKLIGGGVESQANEATSYRLMPPPAGLAKQRQWDGGNGANSFANLQPSPNSGPKSEMTISFEQANGGQPASLASAQVLKLCSCSCQTMVPQPQPVTQPPPPLPTPSTGYPTWPPVFPTDYPTYATEYPAPPTTPTLGPVVYPTVPETPYVTESPPVWPSEPGTLLPPLPTEWPILSTEAPPTETTTAAPTTTTTTMASEPPPTTTTEPPPPPPTTTQASSTLVPTERNVTLQPLASACDQVQWVQPNKTVYASAKIVWDVDRGNQNYFLCNSMLNDELVPGKTHGFSCKLSQEGKAYEGHSFNVLTKPESVNLAWVNKSSTSFGTRNLPVIGGYSKAQDPYIVSRCLVKDENNDVITLIGYVNNQGVGWFPFDDIQIECTKYDVLACVS